MPVQVSVPKRNRSNRPWIYDLMSSIRCKHYGKLYDDIRLFCIYFGQHMLIVKRSGYDVWGKSYTVNNLPSYECVNCQKTIASTRYAPHLEKCLGLSGRQSSRVASRRIGGNSPSFSSDDNVMTPDHDDNRLGSHSPSSFNNKKKRLQQSVSNHCFHCCRN